MEILPGGDSAPAKLITPDVESVRKEVSRARELVKALAPQPRIELVASGDGRGQFGSPPFLDSVMRELCARTVVAAAEPPTSLRPDFDPQPRLTRQFHELAAYSQRLVDKGPQTRAEYISKVDRRSGLAEFEKTISPYRDQFRQEIIGAFDRPRMAANPRTRLVYDEPEYRGYEVVLDVLPEVFLYGILLVPKDIAAAEKRPVVVCQHGLEGRAQFTVEGDHTSYRAFAARLAKRGFVTFSPQHLYRGGDVFRTLQRKANPLKQSLFSVMVAQHQTLLGWLGELAFVDRDRIAFYGISYGGKSAMRIPAVLPGYRLSICSSDFSDWIWRTVSNRFESGYLAHSEYEIFEFGLGERFNYAEMAALICPRPFMVESFHHSGIGEEMSRAEFARVELLYENLNIRDRVRTAYYPEFNPALPYGERKTFDFLHKELNWDHRPTRK
jgi:hypothetical protein